MESKLQLPKEEIFIKNHNEELLKNPRWKFETPLIIPFGLTKKLIELELWSEHKNYCLISESIKSKEYES